VIGYKACVICWLINLQVSSIPIGGKSSVIGHPGQGRLQICQESRARDMVCDTWALWFEELCGWSACWGKL
jgi:hypothetical protein